MTKPKQVQKKLSENTGKTFSVIMPSFTCRGGHNYGNYSTLFSRESFFSPLTRTKGGGVAERCMMTRGGVWVGYPPKVMMSFMNSPLYKYPMTKSGEKIGCQKVGDMALHHITSIRSAGISMYYTHTHSTAKHFSS